MNPFSLKGKIILVTGASAGIGRAISIVCSQMEACLIITGRNKERLNETFISLSGSNHQQLIVDLNDLDSLSQLVNQLPKLDGFVSCAGIINPLLLQFTDENDVVDIMNTNAIAPIHLTRLLVQNKKISKAASLVYISSINGYNCASIGNSIYAASKSALTGFIKAIAIELAPKGIRVNSVNPGMIDTKLFESTNIGSEEFEKDKLNYPLKRYGKPEEVAYAVVYLLSDTTAWITGTNLLIDGGFTLQ
jgi:NAD(P)-dependent dehydrogenase (short-subunit alcohol dehydrogenase family)